MKKAKKVTALLLCAVLLVVGSVTGTMAYLTSQGTVTNTFTVGNVAITLDEADVKPDGTYKTDVNARVDANEYHLLPGHTYIKDPVIHVDANSEDCWVFVKVENGLKAFEDSSVKIASQIAANSWNVLDESLHPGVYYKTYTKGQADKDLEVFASFKLADNAEDVSGWSSINSSTTITVTAYAVQEDGVADAATAWTILNP